MVKHALVAAALAVLAAPATAHAEDAFNMLDAHMSFGALPIDGANTLSVALGLGVEHPVFKKTRVFGEYEWLWLVARPTEQDLMSTLPRPERHGTGQRTLLGLRRELFGGGNHHSIHGFLDGELGGGLTLANDNVHGLSTLPTGFIGLRAGYDLYARNDDSPSRTFEMAFALRAVAVPQGIGMLFGMTLAWGN